MRVTLIGMGPGGSALATRAAEDAIHGADALIGVARLLATVETHKPKYPLVRAEDILNQIDSLRVQSAGYVCVLLTGDAGLYSGAKRLCDLLADTRDEVIVIPGVSSVQAFAAALKEPWQDWRIVSGHGLPCDPVAELMCRQAVCFLTDSIHTPDTLCRALVEAGLGGVRAAVGENLSYPSQRVVEGTAFDIAKQSFAPLNLLLCRREAWPDTPAAAGLPDNGFIRGDVPMTKQEVRAAVLSKLAMRESDIVYDVGAGTGSVSVEIALAARRGRVYAVERDQDACELIRRNAEKYHAHNLRLVEGAAPGSLDGLPAPDAAFIGGGNGALLPIMRAILAKNQSARIAATSVTWETVSELLECSKHLPLAQVELTQVAVSKSRAAGSHHILAAQNPVFLFSARGRIDG
jgi:precorrin-6Y C5,15-methyltransferase (decarboxylating)